MADPEASPQRLWDGELEPEEDREWGAGRRHADDSYRWAGICCGAVANAAAQLSALLAAQFPRCRPFSTHCIPPPSCAR